LALEADDLLEDDEAFDELDDADDADDADDDWDPIEPHPLKTRTNVHISIATMIANAFPKLALTVLFIIALPFDPFVFLMSGALLEPQLNQPFSRTPPRTWTPCPT